MPIPMFLAELLEPELADKDGSALVFTSPRNGSYLTLAQARYGFEKATAAVEGCAMFACMT
ncbi:hypothetical protein [Mycobacterium asiaticum]|uniref:hypothetical protein n=1 Tax=Mycobacterium asiaticum TaxID=1790 RepID=UPI000A0DBE77|nr:hypothetical protein [Mycobacterium asiaticum]ORA17804.1 hypothetical protein BST16_02750 [Mycobacterium asiaticum DSM 44297]